MAVNFGAHSIDELAKGPISRSAIYEAIKTGKLRIKKLGRRTIILDAEWHRFLDALNDGIPEAVSRQTATAAKAGVAKRKQAKAAAARPRRRKALPAKPSKQDASPPAGGANHS